MINFKKVTAKVMGRNIAKKTAKIIVGNIIAVAMLLASITEVHSVDVSIGDVVRIGNQRDNQIMGYGLVVGLPQSGDSRSPLARESLVKLLQYHKIFTVNQKFPGKNIAVVMVSAKLKPNHRSGDEMDIWVSSIGDAKSLEGGHLLQTPLKGADGVVYAVAQTHVSDLEDRRNRSGKRGKKNSIHIIKGAIVERTVPQSLVNANNEVLLSLKTYNLENINLLINTINKTFPNSATMHRDHVIVIKNTTAEPIESYIDKIFKLHVNIKGQRKVVLDRSSGTIVMGENVKISTVGITKNGLTVKVKGDTDSETAAKEAISSAMVEESTTVEDLIRALNDLGLPTVDIIDIIEAVHAAGALHAELIIL